MNSRNTIPKDHFDVLKRLLDCNWQDLAERLGVTPQTLKNWRDNGTGTNGAMRCQDLMTATLRASGSDWLLLQTNWPAIKTIAGKK